MKFLNRRTSTALAMFGVLTASLNAATAQTTAFTYQGRLADNGSPANGTYALQFAVYDASTNGIQIGGTVTISNVPVSAGLFTANLDFGSGVFTGPDRWLQIAVQTNGGASFTTLHPRQQLTATPYAITAGAVTGSVAAGQLTGSLPVSQVSGTVPLNQLPSAVVTNGASGVNITGTMAGNGGGLTNLQAANLTGTLADSQLSTNLARLNIPNTTTQATAGVVIVSGFIVDTTLTNGGWGYTVTPSVTVTDLAGSNAVVTATVSNGVVARLTVQNAGINYSAATTLTIAPPPNTALQTFVSPNIFSGVNTMTNAHNTFAGSFSGNGVGLMNLPSSPPGMVFIPAGTFTMGNSFGEGDLANASPTNVTLSAFYMDVNPVTLGQWQSVYFWATNHGFGFQEGGTHVGKAANHPVQRVLWYDTVKWCNARSLQVGKTPAYYTDAGLTQVYTNGTAAVYVNWAANGYRLPTEAEWEKAARGGVSGQRFPWGNVITKNLANYFGDPSNTSYDLGPSGYNAAFTNGGIPYTSPVGSFAANRYGLYDMVGNVFEWCWDWYGTPYAGGSDPRGPASGSYRVLRGGAWDTYPYGCRAAFRNYGDPLGSDNYIGFRSVLPVIQL